MKPIVGILISVATLIVLAGVTHSFAVVRQRAIPDLTPSSAAELIGSAPEFNRFAALVNVERIDHLKDSMASVSYGVLTFRHPSAPVEAATLNAKAEFRYWEASWHLSQISYGCPADCHIVNVNNRGQE